jgi:hypothetical protein
MEYFIGFLKPRNSTLWNAIQPSEKWGSWRRVFAKNRGLTPKCRSGQKKSPLFGGLESIFLEEDRGDRKHDAASHKNRPMMFHDDSHSCGA